MKKKLISRKKKNINLKIKKKIRKNVLNILKIIKFYHGKNIII